MAVQVVLVAGVVEVAKCREKIKANESKKLFLKNYGNKSN